MPVVDVLRQNASFQTAQGVSQLYEKRRAMAKKIVKLFSVSLANFAERQNFDHLKICIVCFCISVCIAQIQ